MQRQAMKGDGYAPGPLHIQPGLKWAKDIENVKTAINEVVSSMRASLEIEKKDLQDRFADVEDEIKNLPSKELQIVALERNYRIDDNYYTFFLQKRAEAEIQKAGKQTKQSYGIPWTIYANKFHNLHNLE